MAFLRPHARVHACAITPPAGFNESAWLAGDASSRVLSTLQLLAEVEVLSDAHAIAVSYSSNLARLLALTRGARGKARDTAIGVDLSWNFV